MGWKKKENTGVQNWAYAWYQISKVQQFILNPLSANMCSIMFYHLGSKKDLKDVNFL